jgi:hypothetical protein
VAIDPLILDSAPGVYELPDEAPLTNFRPRFNPGRLQIKREGDMLTVYARRGPWKGGCRLSPASADDPEVFAIEPEGYPRSTVILARDSGGQVDSIRLPRLVEMARSPGLEPWA